jgi:hypothetical protein
VALREKTNPCKLRIGEIDDKPVTVLSQADHGFLFCGDERPGEWWKQTRLVPGYFSAMADWLKKNGMTG